jgi:hypothetical protein
MKLNNWEFYVRHAESIKDGTYAIAITDDCLDADCFPSGVINIVSGVVVSQMLLYHSAVYDLPDMIGYDTTQIAEWTQIEPGNSHPQVSHDIMKLSI